MILEKDLQESEALGLEERIARIEKLFEERKAPGALELGILLALKMAKEIRDGKELGSESSLLVAEWSRKFPEKVVEEAISNAKEFLLNSGKLAQKIKEALLSEKEEA